MLTLLSNWETVNSNIYTINYLGHVIHHKNWQCHNTPSTRFKKYKVPNEYAELQSFLEMCNDFRRSLPNFARIAALLNKTFRKYQPTNVKKLPNDRLIPPETLQRPLSPIVLSHARSSGTDNLEARVFGWEAGCVPLLQVPKGSNKLIASWSKSLNNARHADNITHKESLAMFLAVLLLKQY